MQFLAQPYEVGINIRLILQRRKWRQQMVTYCCTPGLQKWWTWIQTLIDCLCSLLYHAMSQCEHNGAYILVWWQQYIRRYVKKKNKYLKENDTNSDPLQCYQLWKSLEPARGMTIWQRKLEGLSHTAQEDKPGVSGHLQWFDEVVLCRPLKGGVLATSGWVRLSILLIYIIMYCQFLRMRKLWE